jgi:large subunit ribosomal protein L29
MAEKKATAHRLREMTRTELETHLKEIKEELWNLEFRRISQEIENPLRLRALRREVARATTLLSEDARGIRRLAGGESKGAGAA